MSSYIEMNIHTCQSTTLYFLEEGYHFVLEKMMVLFIIASKNEVQNDEYEQSCQCLFTSKEARNNFF